MTDRWKNEQLALAALVTLVLTSGCREQAPTPVYAIPRYSALPRDAIAFDCDAAAGYRSEWRQPIARAGKARGALYFASVRRDGDPASANVLIRGPQDGVSISLSFTVAADRQHLQPEIRTRVGGPSKPLMQFRPRPLSGSAFEVEWEPQVFRVRVESTAPWIEVPMAFVPDQLVLGCTSGNTVFHSVHVETGVATAATTRRVLPTKPAGDPPPQNVPPTMLEQQRTAGSKDVTPDQETQAHMVADGAKQIIGSFKICIDEKGEVSSREKLRSTGYPSYDDKIEAAIEEWRYDPYRVLDRAVPVCTAVTFIFRPPAPPHTETPRERALREWDEQHAHERR